MPGIGGNEEDPDLLIWRIDLTMLTAVPSGAAAFMSHTAVPSNQLSIIGVRFVGDDCFIPTNEERDIGQNLGQSGGASDCECQ